MLTIPADLNLESRLAVIARRLGKSPAECALAAITSWVADHEDAFAAAQSLSGGDGIYRMPDDFMD